MFESTSPFDDALSKPLLDEPVKKRWWLGGTFTTSSKLSALSNSSWGSSEISHSQTSSHAPTAVLLEDDDYPDLEAIEFKKLDDQKDDLLGVLQLSPTSIVSEEAYDHLDVSILRTRHQDIAYMNKSLLQLNEIETGKKE
jgi:hypothetical protein